MMPSTTGPVDVLFAISGDTRCHALIEKLAKGQTPVCRVGMLTFAEYNNKLGRSASHYDVEAYHRYWEMRMICEQALTGMSVAHTEFQSSFDTTAMLDDLLRKLPSGSADTLVVDISCVPRMHLTALVWKLLQMKPRPWQKVLLGYTRARSHLTDEERFSVGVTGFAAIPGLAGKIRHEESICIMTVGFEGNRAFAAFRHLSPLRAHVMLGDPADESSDFYRNVSQRNNHQLLAKHRVTSSFCCSLDPAKYAIALLQIVRALQLQYPSSNLYLVPLGTKLQTVGGVLVSLQCPEIQHLFPLPAHRRISVEGIHNTRFIDLLDLVNRIPSKAEKPS